jgi:hypothetical protein
MLLVAQSLSSAAVQSAAAASPVSSRTARSEATSIPVLSVSSASSSVPGPVIFDLAPACPRAPYSQVGTAPASASRHSAYRLGRLQP